MVRRWTLVGLTAVLYLVLALGILVGVEVARDLAKAACWGLSRAAIEVEKAQEQKG